MNSPATDIEYPRPHQPQRVVALPGFGLSMGYTVTYLSFVVLLPLGTLIYYGFAMEWSAFWGAISAPRAVASYALSLGAAAGAAAVNVVFGCLVAWVLTRYRFPGRRILDALVDLPFALPTAVAGIALTAAYAPDGVLGSALASVLGVQAVYTRVGVVLALVFVGFPFVVRAVQPVLEGLDPAQEEAAAALGATRLQTVWRVVLPQVWPALVTGFALSFARGLGEYGSVVFISGNMPMRTEITPLLVMTKLEQFDYQGATALALVMLAASFGLLLVINGLQWRRTQLVAARGRRV
jgi:sulfate transport system permease protein